MRSQEKSSTTYLEFEDNSLLIELFGSQESNLKLLEKELPVIISTRGNRVMIQGEEENTRLAGTVLASLYLRLQEGKSLDNTDVITALRHAAEKESHDEVFLTTKRRVITARSRQQAAYIQCLKENELVFAEGPAGTGKTYLAVAYGVEMMLAGQMDRLILSRPAVEAGERLGFLPGDIREKVDPYLRPLYDALYDMMEAERTLDYGTITLFVCNITEQPRVSAMLKSLGKNYEIHWFEKRKELKKHIFELSVSRRYSSFFITVASFIKNLSLQKF